MPKTIKDYKLITNDVRIKVKELNLIIEEAYKNGIEVEVKRANNMNTFELTVKCRLII